MEALVIEHYFNEMSTMNVVKPIDSKDDTIDKQIRAGLCKEVMDRGRTSI